MILFVSPVEAASVNKVIGTYVPGSTTTSPCIALSL